MNKKRILLIDDHVTWTKVLSSHLERDGRYTVMVENKPLKVLEKALDFRPDLVLCDVDMPDCDGGEVAKRLSELPYAVHIIFLTGLVVLEESQKGERLMGGFQFLAKTAGIPEILACIERVLDSQVAR